MKSFLRKSSPLLVHLPHPSSWLVPVVLWQLLVGGCSRTPLIAQMVAEAFGRPTYVGPHPKHGVALGAALLAEARRRSQRDRGRR